MCRCVIAASLVFVQASAARSRAGYESFLATHGEARANDTVGYDARARIFSQQLEEINRHNANPNATWRMTLNRFSDYTDEEYRRLLGHRRHLRGTAVAGVVAAAPAASSFLQEENWNAITTVQWDQGQVAVKDQGACGSCWAVAVTTALEMMVTILYNIKVEPTSFEQVVDCTPNPKHCGGDGMCKGSTAELGMEYTARVGLLAQAMYLTGYLSRGRAEPATMCHGLPSGLAAGAEPIIRHKGFTRLPSNHLQPVLQALTNGVVVVSVDATLWRSYESGIFTGCDPDATPNHAVLLVGVQKDDNTGVRYFIIRNSWGTRFGVLGNIFLKVHPGDITANQAEGKCGTDYEPLKGVACAGETAPVPVCGECGVLSDSVIPVGVTYHGH